MLELGGVQQMSSATKTRAVPGMQTVDRALQVLLTIGHSKARGLSLAEVARRLDVNKATVHRLVQTLLARDFIRLDSETEKYFLGAACLRLSEMMIESLDLRDQADATLRRLAAATSETVHLGVLDGPNVVYIEKVESSHSVRMFSRVGGTMPAFSTAIGKALLAQLDSEDLHKRLPEALVSHSERTINIDSLIAELETTRQRGWAIDDEENEAGIGCIAAPIFDHRGRAVASLSVAGPSTRMSRDRMLELAPLVTEAATEVSQQLGWSADIGAT